MTPDKAELLNALRRTIAGLQDELEAIDEGLVTIHTNGEDTTEAYRETLAQRIADREQLVAKHDPDGFTVLVAAPTRR